MSSPAVSEAIALKFVDWTKRAIAKELSAMELIGAAEMMDRQGEPALVQQLYKVWIDYNPSDPLLHAVSFNYGVTLSAAGDVPRAREAFTEAIRINPEFLPPYINLGTLLERAGNVDEAMQQWLHLVNRLGGVTGDAVHHKSLALKQLGRVLEGSQKSNVAEDMLQKSLDLNPNQRDVIQHWISLRMNQCKWPVVAPWGTVSRKQLMQAISPLSLAAYSDDPLFQLANAYQYYTQEVRPSGALVTVGRHPRPEGDRGRPLRIGYVSSDLREHAVGFLTAELYGLHDRSKVEVFAYYCGPTANDPLHARIKGSVDHWVDISGLSDTAAAQRIVSDEIDILVDVNGYTKDARTKLFALRPAPIIVNWLGYPGTTASPHHHYIIADEWIIPASLEKYYSEKVVRLPCYQATDRQRVVVDHHPARSEAGLPEDAFVYCCFNGTQKISRFTFQRWMTILKAVPNAVLWLLSSAPEIDERLKQAAAQQGVSPDRIIFAPKLANAFHLSRYPLADLFLDCSPYGAHTTASDALWMGVPVLTALGRGFASRVCGSLVHAAGLGELVCDTLDDYVARAIELGQDPARLRALREKLVAGRDTCTLFDTPGLVRHLEGLYEEMWRDYAAGRLPEPDLANLELYQEICCEQDHEARECQADPDYERRYVMMLAYRHRISPVRPDIRLWTAERVADADAVNRH
jgi:predicted O-linked N-acetylglucosamine transferase (SPINDLY family)